jgi:hypothetical protein
MLLGVLCGAGGEGLCWRAVTETLQQGEVRQIWDTNGHGRRGLGGEGGSVRASRARSATRAPPPVGAGRWETCGGFSEFNVKLMGVNGFQLSSPEVQPVALTGRGTTRWCTRR